MIAGLEAGLELDGALDQLVLRYHPAQVDARPADGLGYSLIKGLMVDTLID